MKFTAVILAGLIPFVTAQDPGPAPTESYGCEPHGDHYHCEGHVSETAAPTSTSGSEEDHDHEHEHDHEHGDEEEDHDHSHDHDTTVSLAPSPTESIGCEPHGDHWHCEGPAAITSGSTTISVTMTTTDATVSLPPSPTASTGCEPHGDHWHCEGPAEGSDGDDEQDGADEPEPTGAAAAQMIPLAGAAIVAALAL